MCSFLIVCMVLDTHTHIHCDNVMPDCFPYISLSPPLVPSRSRGASTAKRTQRLLKSNQPREPDYRASLAPLGSAAGAHSLELTAGTRQASNNLQVQ